MKTLVITALATLALSAALAQDQGFNQGQNDSGLHPEYREFICHARNGRGYQFEGRGFYIEPAQERAIQHCRQFGSLVCELEGCEVIYN